MPEFNIPIEYKLNQKQIETIIECLVFIDGSTGLEEEESELLTALQKAIRRSHP